MTGDLMRRLRIAPDDDLVSSHKAVNRLTNEAADRIAQLEAVVADTDELCEDCSRNLLNHDADENFETWWLCGVCANKRHFEYQARISQLEAVVEAAQTQVHFDDHGDDPRVFAHGKRHPKVTDCNLCQALAALEENDLGETYGVCSPRHRSGGRMTIALWCCKKQVVSYNYHPLQVMRWARVFRPTRWLTLALGLGALRAGMR